MLNAAIRDIPLPPRMMRRPVNERGFPVPWFVEWIDDKPDSVAGLARALGIKPPPHFVVCFPSELEEELLRLEREKTLR